MVTGKPFLLPVGTEWAPSKPETRHGVQVRRIPAWNRRNGTLNRLLHYGTYTVGAAGTWWGGSRPDVCMVLSTPPVLNGLVGALGLRLQGVPFVYNVQDLFPDILDTSRYQGTLLQKTAVRLADTVEQRAARIVPIGRQICQSLRDRGVPEEVLTVIPNPVDIDQVTPVPDSDNNWLRANRLSGSFRVLYAGNLGHAQSIDTILDAAQILSSDTRFQFILVGEGARQAEIQSAVKQHSNVTLLPFAPNDQTAQVLSAGHVGLVPLRADMSRYLVPSKTFSYLAAATPVVAAIEPDSETAQLLDEAGCGWSVPPEDPASLAACLQRLAAAPGVVSAAGARGRRMIAEQYAATVVASKWDQVLRQAAATAAGASQA